MEKVDNYKLRIESVIDTYKKLIFNNPNIIGFGRGVKVINNRWTDIPCLTIYVKEKVSTNTLAKENIIPKYFSGVVTDIEECGESRLLKGPISSGMSIGNENNNFGGTITCALKQDNPLKTYILGCGHALTTKNPETGAIGKRGDYIVCPAKITAEDKGNIRIGRLSDIAPIYIGENKEPSRESPIDAAVVYVDKDVVVSAGLMDGTKIDDIGTTAPGVKAYYIGAASGKIVSSVRSIKGSWKVEEKDSKGNINRIDYSNMTIIIGKFKLGDSGALGIVETINKKNIGFGMLVGGSERVLAFTDLGTTIKYFGLELFK